MEQLIIDVMREGLLTTIKVSLPLLLAALSTGLIVSIFQAATSIQEQTLTFVPKLISIFVTIMIISSWLLTTLTTFTVQIFESFSDFLR